MRRRDMASEISNVDVLDLVHPVFSDAIHLEQFHLFRNVHFVVALHNIAYIVFSQAWLKIVSSRRNSHLGQVASARSFC